MLRVGRLFLAMMLLGASSAGAADWTIVKASGSVSISNGAGPIAISLAEDATVPAGATITTGANGRLMVQRDGTTIIVNPGSVLQLPRDNATGLSRAVEQQGSAEFDVDHRPYQHFSVTTPFMAVVVKGTRFIVRVGNGASAVKVTRGLVGVTQTTTGATVDVKAGQTATISPSSPSIVLTGTVDTASAEEPDTQQTPIATDGTTGNSGKARGKDDNAAAGSSGNDNSGNGNGNSGPGNNNAGGNGNSGNNDNSGPGNNNGNNGNGNSGNGNGNGGSGNGNGNGNSGKG
ncbi:MAG TPA: FecR family protein [Bauldia sp.]|nr:FecR family protein [Bauldia sp.]